MSEEFIGSDRTIQIRGTQELSNHLRELDQRVAMSRASGQGFLSRLFPTAADQEIAAHEGELLRAGFEYRRRVVEMAVEARLQAMEEACNHALVTGKAMIRRERQEFFGRELLRMRRRMDEYAESFNRDIDARFTAIDKYRNAHLRQREEERLLRAVDQFHGLLERLSEAAAVVAGNWA